MKLRLGRVVLFVAFTLLAPGVAGAAPAAVKKIEALNGKAISAYEAGDFQRAEALLLDAVVMAKQNQLGTHAAAARTYLNLGLVNIDGLKDVEKGERYFTLALRIDPRTQMKSNLANPAVAQAFDRARTQAEKERARDEAQAAEQAEVAPAEESGEAAPARAPTAPAEPAANKRQDDGGDNDRREKEWAARQLAEAREEARLKDEKAKAEQQKFREELALTAKRDREREAEAKEERARLLAEKARVEKAREELDRSLSKEKSDLARQLAEARDRESKERQAKEKLQLEKTALLAEKAALEKEKAALLADKDRLLKEKQAETARLLKEKQTESERLAREKQAEKDRLTREKQEVEKRLAETGEREKKERLAKEKLEQERKAALAAEAEAREQAKQKQKEEQLLRAKLAEAPPMPANIPQRLFCQTPDSHPPGVDVYVHCTTQSQVKADDITLHYRPSGHARYSSVGMERTRGGWHRAMIPAAVIKGSMLQYYVQATGGGRVAASNGKPNLPNVTMVNRWTPPAEVAAAGPSPSGRKLTRAAARNRTRPR